MITAESFFDRLNKRTMHLVEDFYASDAEFMDPVVHLKGAAEIRAYYTRLYATVKSIRFEHGPALVQGDTIVLPWTIRLRARARQDHCRFSQVSLKLAVVFFPLANYNSA